MPPTQQQQIDALKMAVKALQDRQDKADQMRKDTHDMVSAMAEKVNAMHSGLMEPQLGQGEKSLIERMADVTVNIEAAQRTAGNMGKAARWIAAIALAVGLFVAAWKAGHAPQP